MCLRSYHCSQYQFHAAAGFTEWLYTFYTLVFVCVRVRVSMRAPRSSLKELSKATRKSSAMNQSCWSYLTPYNNGQKGGFSNTQLVVTTVPYFPGYTQYHGEPFVKCINTPHNISLFDGRDARLAWDFPETKLSTACCRNVFQVCTDAILQRLTETCECQQKQKKTKNSIRICITMTPGRAALAKLWNSLELWGIKDC